MREVIATPHAPQAIGPYSQAIRAAGLIFSSGHLLPTRQIEKKRNPL